MAYNYIEIIWFYVAFHFVSCYHVILNYEIDDKNNYLSFYHTDQYQSVMI